MTSKSIKCAFEKCVRLVGPIRQKISKFCYQCDRNLEEWSRRGYNRRVEWKRRCELSVSRQDALPKGAVTDNDVAAYVRKIVTASMRKKEKGK